MALVNHNRFVGETPSITLSGADLTAVILYTTGGDGGVPTAATINGVALTLVDTAVQTGGEEAVIGLFYGTGFTSGTYATTATWSLGGRRTASTVWDVIEYNGASSVANVVLTTLGTQAGSHTISVASSESIGADVLAAAICADSAASTGTITNSAGGLTDYVSGSAGYGLSGSGVTTLSASPTTISFDINIPSPGGGSTDRTTAITALIQSGGGSTVGITSVSSDTAFSYGDTGIAVAGTGLDTVTSAVLKTSDDSYTQDVFSSYSASSATAATFTATRGSLPLSTSSYQLQLELSDGTTTVAQNVTINPASGEAVVEAAGTLVISGDSSVATPYTGPDPVVGDQVLYETTSSGSGVVSVSADLSFTIDYTAVGSVPATDSFNVEMWSSDGTSRTWTSYAVSVSEPVPAGTITFGTIFVTDSTATIPFTYDASDQTGFEGSTDGGSTWVTVSSPITRAGLTESTMYSGSVRAVNGAGAGTTYNYSFTTTASTSGLKDVTLIKQSIKENTWDTIKETL